MKKFNNALPYLIDLLARREYSFKELENRLKDKSFSNSDKELALQLVVEDNLQSDLRYAEMIVRSRYDKGYGKNYIKQYLYQKGISKSLITDVLNNQQYDWYAKARDIFINKANLLDLTNIKDKNKLYNYMLNHGFYQDEFYYLFDEFNKDSLED